MDDSLIFYVVCEYVCIFGLTLNTMMCNHIRKNPNTNTTKLQHIQNFIVPTVWYFLIITFVKLCGSIIGNLIVSKL